MKKIYLILFALALYCLPLESNAQCPTITPTLTGSTIVCSPYIEMVYTTDAGKPNYNWYITGGNAVSGGGHTDNTVSIYWYSTGPLQLTVSYMDASDCSGSTTIYPIYTPVQPTISGSPIGDEGISNIYTTEAGKSNYNWYVSNGASIVSGANTNTIEVLWTLGGNQAVYISYSDVNGCVGSSQPKYVSVTPAPYRTITNATTGTYGACQGTSIVFTTETGKLNYDWTVTGGTITSGGNTSSVTVNWTQSGTQNINVFYTNPTGPTNPNPTTSIFSVLEKPPTPIITGNAVGCLNDDVSYQGPAGFYTYFWSFTGEPPATRYSMDGAVGTVWRTPGNKTVTLNAMNYSGCYPDSPGTLDVFVPDNTPVISGDFNPCSGSYVYSTAAGMSNYHWTMWGPGVVASGGTAADNSVTVAWSGSGPAIIYLNYTDTNGCMASTEKTFPVRQAGSPVNLYGTTTVCQGASNNFHTDYFSPGMMSASWSASPDGIMTSGGGPDDSGVNFQWDNPGIKTVTLALSSQFSCPVPVSLTVNVLPASPITITGPSTVCAGIATTYTTEPGNSYYDWYYPYGTLLSTWGTNSLTIMWNTSGPQILQVSYIIPGGCTLTSRKNILVNTPPTPTLSGNATTCALSPGNVYTTEPGKTNYVWTVPSDALITAGGTSTDNSVTVLWYQPGNEVIKVNYDDAQGCHALTPTTFNVSKNPRVFPTISSLTGHCLNAVNHYTTEPGMTNYSWTVDPSGTIGGGGGSSDNFVDVTWNSTGSKDITVNYVNSSGCTTIYPTTSSYFIFSPTIPSISGVGNLCLGQSYSFSTQYGNTNYNWHYGSTSVTYPSNNTVSASWNSPGTNILSVSFTDIHGCVTQENNLAVQVSSYPSGSTQTVSWTPVSQKNVGDAPYDPGAVSDKGMPVTYASSNPAVATVSGSLISIVGAGTSTITAYATGTSCLPASNTLSQVLTVNKNSQTITFNALPLKTYGNASFALGATTTSPLTVSYSSSNTSVATVSGSTVTIVGAGATTITALQPGDSYYAAATSVAQLLTVNKANLTITADSKSKVAGTPNPPLTISYAGFVNGEGPGSLTTAPTISTTATTSSPAGTYPITASSATSNNYNIIYVNGVITIYQLNQTITFSSIPTKTYPSGAFALDGTASSGLPITYTSSNTNVATISGNIVTLVCAGTSIITASQAGDITYNPAANVTQVLTVSPSNQFITFYPLPTRTFGDGQFGLSASSSSGLPVSFSSSNTGVATVSGNTVTIAGGGYVIITASQPGNACYNAAPSVDQGFWVNKADQTITFSTLTTACGPVNPAPSPITSLTIPLSASSSAGLPITFSSSDPGTAFISGNSLIFTQTGAVTVTATQAGDNGHNAVSTSQVARAELNPIGVIYRSGDLCTPGYYPTLMAGDGSNYSWGGQFMTAYAAGGYPLTYNTPIFNCPVFTSILIDPCGGGGGGDCNGCDDFRIKSPESDKTDSSTGPTDPYAGKLLAYPNPVNKDLYIHLPEPANDESELRLIDIMGKTHVQQTIQKGETEKVVNAENLVPGMYFIQVGSGKSMQIKNVVVVH